MQPASSFQRRLDGEDGNVFRIKPVRPVEALRAAGRSGANRQPKTESSSEPDLVELTALDPSIKLDIRYATTNNFLSVPVYKRRRLSCSGPRPRR